MATDLATLAIKVESGDTVKATTALNSMAVAGGKTEAATQRLTRRMALLEIEARKMDVEMHSSAAATARLSAELQKQAEASAKLEMAARRQNAELQNTAKSGLASASAIRNAFAALGLGLAIREVSTLSDSYTNLRSRLSLVTEGTKNLNAVQEALFQSAQRTRTSFEATVDLYGRIARNAAGLGASQADILKVTEAVSKAMIISGNSAETSAAAIIQLGQAFASGTLQGDEFRSIMENAPVLAQAIARGLGVTVGQLREMSKEGKLTAQAVFDAIKKQGDALTTEFERMPRTISGAMQQMRNEVLKTLGGSGELATATGGIVTSLDAIRNAIGPTARAVNAFFGGFSIAAADAAVGMEKLRQKTAEWQMGIGLAIRATGNKSIGDALIGNAAKVMKDGDDITRMLEKQRDVTIETVHAITTAGTVSTVAPPPVVTPDLNALKAYKKLMEELRDVTTDLARAQLDAQIAGAKANAEAAAAIQDELTQSDLLLQAARQGEAAYKAQQREIEVLNELTRQGITLSDRDYEAKRRAVEQAKANQDATKEILDAQKKAADEAEREAERRAKDIRRATVSNIEGILTDISNRKNPLIAMAEGFKRALIRAMSEALAERFLASKLAAMMGLGVEGAAKKQLVASVGMNEAARLQKEAADIMLRAAGFDPSAPPPPNRSDKDVKVPAWVNTLKKIGEGAIVAYAGFQAGSATAQSLYSQSHGAFGNYARGAIGGAAAGAVTGAIAGSAFGPIGAAAGTVIGGVTGLIGGILGIGKAAKEAAKQTEELRKALSLTMAGLRAEVGKDALAASIAQVEAQREQIRKQIEDAYSGGGANSDTVRERNRQLAELNQLEDTRIQQLREEAAVMVQRQQEDYRVRQLRASGQTSAADALAFQLSQQREREDLMRSFGSEIDATEQMTLAALDAALAAEREARARGESTSALNAFTTAVRNAPTGFKLEQYIQQYAKGAPYPGTLRLNPLPLPQNPFVPPMSPLSPPMLSRTGTVATAPVQMTFAPGAIVVQESKSPQETAKEVVREIRRYGASRNGLNGDTANALNTFPV